MDLVCEPKHKITLVGSAYFIGFAMGFGLFSLPDNYGRKKFLNFTMPVYLVASLVVVHHQSLVAKGIGFFVQGLLHVKIPVCYTYMFEMAPQSSRVVSTTLISAFDECCFGVFGVALLFWTHDAVKVLQLVNVIESAAVLLFLLVAPESPTWLYNNEDYLKCSHSLRYVAFANGKQLDRDITYQLL